MSPHARPTHPQAHAAALRQTREATRLREASSPGPTTSGSPTPESAHDWKRWGTYLAERQWATVREDYSAHGDSWGSLTYEDACARAYRWGEDGLLGFTDRKGRLAFALALWNGQDPILKERLFGLTGPEGNHGEDVKELYYYLDATPTHSYQKALYKYPQGRFPYEALREAARERGRDEDELELLDTGTFDDDRYFDVVIEYAKEAPEDILVVITVTNRSAEPATLHLVPQLWFRNTWSWGLIEGEDHTPKPRLWRVDPGTTTRSSSKQGKAAAAVGAEHATLGRFTLAAGAAPGECTPTLLFTDNSTNIERLYGAPNPSPYTKDAFHRRIVSGDGDAVNPEHEGTKAGVWYRLELGGGATQAVQLRLTRTSDPHARPEAHPFGPAFEAALTTARADADAFYAALLPPHLSGDERLVARQAYAGLLWSKQFYHYSVRQWLDGDPGQPPPPTERLQGRNTTWLHLYNRDIISMPDAWEYPWYASWDLAFHTVALARIDPAFAKEQLLLLCREWYMHPSGQLPAYEFGFSDVNPPVHAWAAWQVYTMTGRRDRDFLERIFHKLLINFTWWVNRTDSDGNNIFTGGFLGLDNVGVFDRSHFPAHLGELEQADATAWMAFYCLRMLEIALELANANPTYEDVASKFFEHFAGIMASLNALTSRNDPGERAQGLWDESDGFYYDAVRSPRGTFALRVRSTVGLLPLIAVLPLEQAQLDRFPGFRRRLQWFLRHGQLAEHVTWAIPESGSGQQARLLLSAVPRDRLERILARMLDPEEFLSPFGLRSLSRAHAAEPYVLEVDGQRLRVDYEPGESRTPMFGGNSNWRGPVWLPTNFLLIEALQRYDAFYGDDLTVEHPTGSGTRQSMGEVAADLQARLGSLLTLGSAARPCHGSERRYLRGGPWEALPLFYEYFHAETGRGLGASHQTGWTSLVARCLEGAGRDLAFTAALARQLEGPDGAPEGPLRDAELRLAPLDTAPSPQGTRAPGSSDGAGPGRRRQRPRSQAGPRP